MPSQAGSAPRVLTQGLLLALALTLAPGCGSAGGQGGSAKATPATPPAAPPPQPDRGKALQPIPPDLLARYGHVPLNQQVMAAYNQHLQALAEASRYGPAFLEVPAEQPPPYAEGYFTFQGRDQSIRFKDGIQRPLIRTAHDPGNGMTPTYEHLFQLCHAEPAWDPGAPRRASGFLFTGSKLGPARLAESGAICSSLFAPTPEHPIQPKLLDRLKGGHSLGTSFNLRRHLFYSEHTGFVSLTRSVHVARYFAVNVGTVGQGADDGYVYVVQASAGLDGGGALSHFRWEQEVAVPGLVPWGRVVAYRRLVRNPGTAAAPEPPEFVGPIHVREQLQALEPQAYARIVHDLSVNSLFTKAFREGADWRPLIPRNQDEAYLDDFKSRHPWLPADDPSLWN